MGYDLSDSLVSEDALRALNMAVKLRKYTNETIHHSDKGLQYCCNGYQDILREKKIDPV